MNKIYLFVFISFLFPVLCSDDKAQDAKNIVKTIKVSNVNEFKSAILNLVPGTVLEVNEGEYYFDKPLFIKLNGLKDKPITIKAKKTLKAIIKGEGGFSLKDCSYVTIEGFSIFTRAVGQGAALMIENSENCRITRNYIQLDETTGFSQEDIKKLQPHSIWIFLEKGKNNRFDHNLVRGHRNGGVTLNVGNGETCFRIDHNHFLDRPKGNGNGFETIRLGLSFRHIMNGVVDYNLFENCDGEGEIISVKSNQSRFSHNTFRNCAGQLVVRGGHNVLIDHNFFLNSSDKRNAGGVRIHGNDNSIIRNYFEGLTAPAIESCNGDYDYPPLNSDNLFGAVEMNYRQTKRAYIAANTFMNCARFMSLGKNKLSLPPENWSIQYNIVVVKSNETSMGKGQKFPFIEGESENGFRWNGNIFWRIDGPVEIGRKLPDGAVNVIDPKLIKSEDGLYRLAVDSPAIGAGAGRLPEYLDLDLDMDGQCHVGVFDTGADEYSSELHKYRPLMPEQVGPDSDNNKKQGN